MFTEAPAAVPGHRSASFITPSPSSSSCDCAHPFASTVSPDGVLGHKSTELSTPSPSSSDDDATIQPSWSIVLPIGVFRHLSNILSTPSPSRSLSSAAKGATAASQSQYDEFNEAIPIVVGSQRSKVVSSPP